MKTFKEWAIEEAKKKGVPQGVKDFIAGKTDSVKLEPGKQAIGHQALSFRTGAHDSRPRRERTRSGQKRRWEKEQD